MDHNDSSWKGQGWFKDDLIGFSEEYNRIWNDFLSNMMQISQVGFIIMRIVWYGQNILMVFIPQNLDTIILF